MHAMLRIILLVSIMLTLGHKRYDPEVHHEISKEQLVSFVKEARAFIKIYGKEEALREFNDPKGLFVRGELYIHANDFKCIVLASGRDAKLKGVDFAQLTDPNSTKICQDKVNILMKNPSGWLEYTFVHPKTNRLMKKLTYFERVDNENWYISSGMYIEE